MADAPESIANYRIISRLGAGGMGEVFLGEDARLDRRVAIKRLKPGAPADPSTAARLLVEARAAARLDHPHICGIYEVGEDAGGPFIVMPLLEGVTLAARLAAGPLPITEALDLGAQIADALAEAHRHGILHRDIKPANVMVSGRGQARVMDFGLAKITTAEAGSASAIDTINPLTAMGTTLGTAAYMSPEQARGERVDARSDLFSLGVVLHEMIAGRRPFDGHSLAEILTATQTQDPPPLARFRPDTPDAVQRIVTKALRRSPAERYQSADDLLVDLRAARAELESSARLPWMSSAPTASSSRRVTTRDIVVVGGLAAALVIGIATLMPRVRDRAPAAAAPATTEAITSLAVLPLANNSGSADKEYVADGITESLIRNLSQVPSLKVISRNTAFRFKGRGADAQAIAKQLGVRAVMTGVIRRVDDELVIDVELSRAGDGSVILSRQYLKQSSGALALESDIAEDVVRSLKVQLSGAAQQLLAKRPTNNADAYQFYLRGRFLQKQLTPDSLHRAIEQFQLAVRADPNYAQAYADIGGAYQTLGTFFDPPKDTMPRARAFAKQALAIDPMLGDAHLVLGMVSLMYDWNPTEAAREMVSGGTLVAGAIEAFSCTAHLLQATGHSVQAETCLKTALETDPLSTELNTEVGCIAYYRKNYDTAIRGYREALQFDPRNDIAYYGLGRAYAQQGKYAEALDELKRAETMNGSSPPLVLAEMGYVYAKSGKVADAQAMIRRLTAPNQPAWVDPYFIATIYMGLGDRGHALEWLVKAEDVRSSFIPSVPEDPKWDAMRDDPRFKALVKRLGFS